jgi:hypothetical protein
MVKEYKLTLDDIINTVSVLVESNKVTKEGLTLHYSIPEHNHLKLDETLYYKFDPNGKEFEHRDVIEIELGGINIIITKSEN